MVGIDLVALHRFSSWLTKDDASLRALFSEQECRELRARMDAAHPEARNAIGTRYLASRFAVKEAAYKAISQLLVAHQQTQVSFSLQTFAPYLSVTTDGTWQVPQLLLDRNGFTQKVGITLPVFDASVSLSHDGAYAIAMVQLSPSAL